VDAVVRTTTGVLEDEGVGEEVVEEEVVISDV
jgi:hypothetical protein